MNTITGLVAEAGQGEGAAALSPMGTIDRGQLRWLLLPSEQEEREALEYLDERCRAAAVRGGVNGRAFSALNLARVEVSLRWRETVRCICDRGGLLLIGGRA